MALELLDHAPGGELPDYNLRVLARRGQKLVALAHVHVRDVVGVAVEGGLQAERLPVPNLD